MSLLKLAFISALTFVGLHSVFSQNQRLADSLKIEYQKSHHSDSSGIVILQEIAFNETHPDTKLHYANLLVKLTANHSEQYWTHLGYFFRGNAYRLKGDYDLAFSDYFRALDFALKIKYHKGIGAAYSVIADTYSLLGDSKNSVSFYKRGISELRAIGDSIQLATALLNAGDQYVNMGKLDSAVIFFMESTYIFNEHSYYIGQAYSLGNMGLVNARQKNYELAEINLLEATYILDELGDSYAICDFQLYMSDIYFEVGELKLALEYAKRTYEIAVDQGLKEQIRDASQRLSKIYDQLGKSSRALSYLKSYVAFRDSMNNAAVIQKMSDLRREFEVAQARAETRKKLVAAGTELDEISSTNPIYYALIIGVDDYLFSNENLLDLENPVSDAGFLRKTLQEQYAFESKDIVFVENPSRSEVIEAFEIISEVITEKDNLLIFYAGHGVWDDKLNVGYWLPADATSKSKVNWISNSTIRDYISGLPTKHTLLISDACFSGSIFKTRQLNNELDDYGFYKIYKMSSRKAMTSGTLDSVPDESRFMKYLLKALNDNSKEYLSARQLFHGIETAVINNTRNVPQYGTIQNAGDEGGDFIFIRKN